MTRVCLGLCLTCMAVVPWLSGCAEKHVGASAVTTHGKAPTPASGDAPQGAAGAETVGVNPTPTSAATTEKPPAPAEVVEQAPAPAITISETRIRTPARSGLAGDAARGIQEITFDSLKFEMQSKEELFRRDMLTPAIEALHGKTVRLRGYILPPFQPRGLKQIVLMRDNQECCFGPGAWIYDCVIVDMKEGKTADYTTRPVAVEGTFEVSEYLDPDGKPLSVYHITGESVK